MQARVLPTGLLIELVTACLDLHLGQAQLPEQRGDLVPLQSASASGVCVSEHLAQRLVRRHVPQPPASSEPPVDWLRNYISGSAEDASEHGRVENLLVVWQGDWPHPVIPRTLGVEQLPEAVRVDILGHHEVQNLLDLALRLPEAADRIRHALLPQPPRLRDVELRKGRLEVLHGGAVPEVVHDRRRDDAGHGHVVDPVRLRALFLPGRLRALFLRHRPRPLR
mmetsp:Transcript_64913/g.184310  ORF Transcript_64913/g.184310 Transcript_64913/m.184310 type:complete len:223 (+) Transcript_64913:960-1628(+)